MIASIKGVVDTILDDSIIIEIPAGIGYHIFITKNTIDTLSIGSEKKLYTYMSITENKTTLYGFDNYQEVNFFKLLVSVNGIGSKVAMGLLNTSSSTGLAISIVASDIKKLQQAPGVGAKTAQRLVLELKDKIAKISNPTDSTLPALPQGTNDAASALIALGYTPKESYEVVAKVSKTTTDLNDLDIEQIIKMSLRELSRQSV